MSKETWERIYTFGRHSHVVDDNKKTLCGKDVSMFMRMIQNNPPRKCMRCQKISKIYDRLKQLEEQNLVIEI